MTFSLFVTRPCLFELCGSKNSYIIPDGAKGESIMGVLNIIAGESLVTYILSGKKFKFVPHHLLKSVH